MAVLRKSESPSPLNVSLNICASQNQMGDHLKKKDIKFCPLCAGIVSPEKKGAYVVCVGCGFTFSVNRKPVPSPRVAVVGGHAHRHECIGNGNAGKLCHSSVAEAYARALTLEDIPHRHRDKMEFYLCRWCEKIHMGHGGKGRKDSTVSYTNYQARSLYEQVIENGELTPYPEDWHEKIQK